MTHNKEKDHSIETDLQITETRELAEKHIYLNIYIPSAQGNKTMAMMIREIWVIK